MKYVWSCTPFDRTVDSRRILARLWCSREPEEMVARPVCGEVHVLSCAEPCRTLGTVHKVSVLTEPQTIVSPFKRRKLYTSTISERINIER